MPYDRPTIKEIYDRVIGDVEASIDQTTPILKKALIRVLSKVFAGAVHLLFGFLDWLSRQVFPDTAESEYLDRWSSFWGVERKPSTFAEYNIDLVGTNGADLPQNSIFQSVSEIEYATLDAAIISAGVATVRVRAKTSGTVGDLETGDELQLVAPVAGIDSTGIVSATDPLDGVDEEDDEALRTRLLARIQNPPQGGAKNDYVAWAKEVPGVTRAWCYPTYSGPGTVGVTFVLDEDDDSIIPDSLMVQAVQDYIDDPSRKPVTADVTVFAPVERSIDFEIELTPNDDDVKIAVTRELTDLIFREAIPGGTLLISHVREAISGAAGEEDNDVLDPVADTLIAENEIGVLGTITWH